MSAAVASARALSAIRQASGRVVTAAGVIGDSLAQRQVVPDAFNRAATAVATVVKNREVFGMGGAGGATTQLTPVAPIVQRAPAPIAPAAVPAWETSLPVVGTLPTVPTLTPVAPVITRAPAATPPTLVPANVPPIVTTAPPATTALTPYVGGPTVTTAPSTTPAMSMIMDTRPIGGGAPISLSPPGGIRGAIGTVVGTAISRGVDWATRQITGSGGGGAPAIPSGGGSMPGVGQMGIGSTVGRIGGAVGGAVGGMIAKGRKSKKWEKVIDAATGVAVWLLIDQATGAILGRRDKAPVRHMNVLNVRALRRADRRMDGFRKVARKVLSSQGFTVQRRGTGRSCAPKRKRSC